MTSRARAPRVIVATEAVIDAAQLRAIADAVRAVEPGAIAVLFRDVREESANALEEVRGITRAHGALLIVKGRRNGDARGPNEGAHLGSQPWDEKQVQDARDSDRWVSVAAHADDDVTLAASLCVTAALVSPIYKTPGKQAPRGLSAIASAAKIALDHDAKSPLLVYALGGVTKENAPACIEAGAFGVCVIRAVLAAEDPAGAAALLVTVVTSAARC